MLCLYVQMVAQPAPALPVGITARAAAWPPATTVPAFQVILLHLGTVVYMFTGIFITSASVLVVTYIMLYFITGAAVLTVMLCCIL
jgi:hypothetical protein